jgi:N-hydroxyarylamine O-acetyltransferase
MDDRPRKDSSDDGRRVAGMPRGKSFAARRKSGNVFLMRDTSMPPIPLSVHELDRYRARIGFHGSGAPTIDTLLAVHRAHLLAIPYENLDIHVGRPLSLDPAAMFAKLVDGRRGGWCYEMNGLMGRALASMGFDVRYVSGAVNRATLGNAALDNHLVLIVTLDRSWIVDVGFGDGFIEPLPLEPGTYRQGFLEYCVRRDGDWWRVDNHAYGGADGFDFTLEPRTLDTFAARCHALQTLPESPFVQTTVCERFVPGGLVILRGAVLRDVTASGVATRVVPDADEYVQVLRDRFDLDLPEMRAIWPEVHDRHLEWEASRESPAQTG